MKLKIILFLSVVLLSLLIVLSQTKNKPFAPAADFPREALVYVQIADLPKFIKFWNDSKFKEKYLESENFKDFQNNHLGRKLASRWEEFNEAAGFQIDLEDVGGLTENRAAFALYDIGKMDFVFIASVSDEVFAAAKFVQNQDKFEEQMIDADTTVYRVDVEADRGRQKQQLIYAHTGGKFILATSEKLFAQTLQNIRKNNSKNSLADEPSFKILSEKVFPGTATVWVNQEKLNEDYYFKRYWLMSDVAEQKNIKAGIFDFSEEEGKLIERRKFLLNKAVNLPPLKKAEVKKSLAHMPENIPFYRLKTANKQAVERAIRETVFDKEKVLEPTRHRHSSYSSYDSFDSYGEDYSYLNEDFDKSIDESDEDVENIKSRQPEINFAEFLGPAAPSTVLTFTEPKALPAPLFTEFRRAAIFNLASPAAFRRDSFESAIEKNFSAEMMISAPGANFKWEAKSENNLSWRELNVPMTGWQAVYTINGNELILANNADFLKEIMTTQNNPDKKPEPPFTELTVLNLDQRTEAYDKVFNKLSSENNEPDFFTGNVKSLLDAASNIKNIEIKRNYSGVFLEEEITMNLRNAE